MLFAVNTQYKPALSKLSKLNNQILNQRGF